jgi:ArsR family transcriptional regulator, arsenate/arsenite/antimonite-responsive transcriptional repressor
MSEPTLSVVRSDGRKAGELPSASMPAPVMDANGAIALMTVLAHRLRIDVWCKLVPCGPSGLTAGAIATHLNIKPSSLSFHLSQMAKVGALKVRHDGRHTIYSVHTDIVSALCGFLAGTISHDPVSSTSTTS